MGNPAKGKFTTVWNVRLDKDGSPPKKRSYGQRPAMIFCSLEI
jgi:hypothetical protein